MLRLTCACGKELEIEKDALDPQVLCPSCQRPARLPGQDATASSGVTVLPAGREDISRTRIITQTLTREQLLAGGDLDDPSPEEADDSAWMRVVCYQCKRVGECLPIVFYSAVHMGNQSFEYLQRHSIVLCQKCCKPGWNTQLRRRAALAIVALVVLALLFALQYTRGVDDPKERTTTSIVLVLIALWAYRDLVHTRNRLANPTFTPDVMEKVAIEVAKHEIMADTGANSFFTTAQLDEMHIFTPTPSIEEAPASAEQASGDAHERPVQ